MKIMIKQISFIAVLILCSIGILILSACSSINLDNQGKTIIDSYGREVWLPENVKSIAVVGSAARFCVYAGAQEKIVAITDAERANEQRPYTIAFKDLFNNLPSTNNGNHLNNTNVDKEKLLSIAPDVILSSRSSAECQNLQENINIPVVGVFSQDEIFDSSVYKAIEICGQVADTQEHAKKTINFIKKANDELSDKCTGNQAKIYRGAVNFKGAKNLCGTVSNYCIYEVLNLNNVAKNKQINHAYDTSLEQIYNWNPDYIFMDYPNKIKIQEQKSQNEDVFNQIEAFKSQNAYYVSTFNNNGTNIEYGLCEAYFTASILYPESFSDVNLYDKFKEIFKIIDGKDIYNELVDLGLYFGKAEL